MTESYYQMITIRLLDLIDDKKSDDYVQGIRDALNIIKEETGNY